MPITVDPYIASLRVETSGEAVYGQTYVSLPSAQLKLARATPITLVPAPGPGMVLEFVSAEFFLKYGGTNAFTVSTNNFVVRYQNATGAIVSETATSAGWLDQTADAMLAVTRAASAARLKTACENKALVLHNSGAGEIAGNAANNNVVRVRITYRVQQTGW